jgi:hypothetical protein
MKSIKHTMKVLFSSLFFLGLIACDTEIEIEMPKTESKLALDAVFTPFSPYSTVFNFKLYPSYDVLDTADSEQIKDALVLFYHNGVLENTLIFDEDNEGYVSSEFYFPEAGQSYAIKVYKEGFDTLTASSYVPEQVPIDTVSVTALAGVGQDSENLAYSSVSLTFTDPENEENYYEITVKDVGIDPYQIWTSEPIITQEAYYPSDLTLDKEYPERLLFNDTEINGEKKTIVVYYEPPQRIYGSGQVYVSSHIIYVYLNSVTKEYYDFFTSALLQINNREGDLFYGLSEPVEVSTNVNNGYGVFAGYNTDAKIIYVDTIRVR